MDSAVNVAAHALPAKPAGEGTALGRAICETIVASLHGEISVESTVRRGAKFAVVLPRTANETPGVSG